MYKTVFTVEMISDVPLDWVADYNDLYYLGQLSSDNEYQLTLVSCDVVATENTLDKE
jgi:hypothetical protein